MPHRLLATACLLLALVPTLPAQTAGETNWSGIPGILCHQWRTFDDGTRVSAWDVLLLFHSERAVNAEGELLGSTWTLFPVASFGTRPGEAHRYIFPFVWLHAEDETGQAMATSWILMPLIAWDTRVHGELSLRTRMVFPLYRQHGVWPDDQTGEPEKRSDWGVFPAFWGWRDDAINHVHLFPLLFWNAGRSLTVFPIFWWGESHMSVVPLWGRYENTQIPPPRVNPDQVPWTQRFWYLLFPLYIHFTEDRGEDDRFTEHHVLWPLIAWGDGPSRTERRLFPLWRRGWQEIAGVERTSVWALTPLCWHGRIRAGERLLRGHDVVFPLYFDFRWLGLGISELSGKVEELESRMQISFPLWIQRTVGGDLRDLSLLWPLYIAQWRPLPRGGDPEQSVFAYRILLLLAGYERQANDDSVFDILGFLFRRERSGPEIHSRLLWILFSTDRDPEADTARVALLWRLVEYERTGDDRGLRLLYLPWQIPLP